MDDQLDAKGAGPDLVGPDLVIEGKGYGLVDDIQWDRHALELRKFENSAIADAEPRRFFNERQALATGSLLRNVQYPPVFRDTE